MFLQHFELPLVVTGTSNEDLNKMYQSTHEFFQQLRTEVAWAVEELSEAGTTDTNLRDFAQNMLMGIKINSVELDTKEIDLITDCF